MTRRDLRGTRLVVATHNAGKLEEIAALVAPHGLTVAGAASLGLAEPAETEATFVGNARIKALAAVAATGLPALADDSGLEVEALNGAPGVHTADWAATPAGRDFTVAMERTWSALEAVQAPYPRRARFRATMVLAWPDGAEAIFEGAVQGDLVWPPRGRTGHGFDPMFRPEGHALTFAEMTPEAKNAISHRAIATRAFLSYINGL